MQASDPDHHDPGPALFCKRNSDLSSSGTSRALGVSRYHMRLSDPGGNYWIYTVTRSP